MHKISRVRQPYRLLNAQSAHSMRITVLELTDYGLVLHDLGAFAIPVAVQKVTLVPIPMQLVCLSRVAMPLTVGPHSLVNGTIVAPMPAVTMAKTAP